jgi:hypothetical protein
MVADEVRCPHWDVGGTVRDLAMRLAEAAGSVASKVVGVEEEGEASRRSCWIRSGAEAPRESFLFRLKWYIQNPVAIWQSHRVFAAYCFAYPDPLPRQSGRWKGGVSGHREPVPSSLTLLVSFGDPPHLRSPSSVPSIHSSVNYYFPKVGW